MAVRTMAARDLRIGYVVMPASGPPRRVTSHRLQGAPPQAVVQYAGMHSWHHLGIDDQVLVETEPRRLLG